jgi:thioredoxin reductase
MTRPLRSRELRVMDVEILIVGGGPAGLSAALVLGRCHRQVLVCDEGMPRNRASPAIHGLLGREGMAPSHFLATACAELTKYATVQSLSARVQHVVSTGNAFQYSCSDGTRGTASKVLLASGLVDDLPAIAGIDEHYGISVHHCLYCDGFEYRGRAVAAYGLGDRGAALGLMMRHWMSDVVVCSDGSEISAGWAQKLREHDIAVRSEKVRALIGEGGRLSRLDFDCGSSLSRQALFFATGCQQASDLSQRLGCKRDERGGVVTDPVTEDTSVPGVYVAGDGSRDVLMVSIAIAEGAKAAVAINKAFLRQDGFCE